MFRIMCVSCITLSSFLFQRAIEGGEIEIHNLSNETVYVLKAFNRGNQISTGWFTVKLNEERSFRADDDNKMYLRIIHKGRPLFNAANTDRVMFPVNTKHQFHVRRTDVDSILTFRWDNGQHERNVKKGDVANWPSGWVRREFFRVRSGKRHIDVKP